MSMKACYNCLDCEEPSKCPRRLEGETVHKLKVACDNQVSNEIKSKLTKSGFQVVTSAFSLPDEDWLMDAIGKGVDVIISPDLDIPNFLDRYNLDGIKWIDVPQGYKYDKLEKYLFKQLNELTA